MNFLQKGWTKLKIKAWYPVIRLARQGVTPEKLALTSALAIVLGIIPIIGPMTIIVTLIAIRLRLNVPAMLGIFYAMYPLQIMLFIPFIELGTLVFQTPGIPYSRSEVVNLFQASWYEASLQFGESVIMGLAAWAMLAVPLGFILYYSLIPLFRKFQKKNRTVKYH